MRVTGARILRELVVAARVGVILKGLGLGRRFADRRPRHVPKRGRPGPERQALRKGGAGAQAQDCIGPGRSHPGHR